MARAQEEQEEGWRRVAPPPPPLDIERYAAAYRSGLFSLVMFMGLAAGIILLLEGELAGIALILGSIGFAGLGFLLYYGRGR